MQMGMQGAQRRGESEEREWGVRVGGVGSRGVKESPSPLLIHRVTDKDITLNSQRPLRMKLLLFFYYGCPDIRVPP